MRKHFTRVLTALLVAVMLLPIVVQATPADGWTDEAEQAYQTVTELVVQRVTESKDYLAAATQEENAKAVYALWTSGAAVPGGFYDEYLQALADWLDLAVKRGKTPYIPGAIRTVAAMGLDVTDFAGHDLMDGLRKPELVEADEDRLDMLMDLDAAGDAGKAEEFNALRETLLTEALARQQSSGEFRYTSKWPAELKQKGVDDEPDRFDYILLTAKSVQALAPYRSRKNVSTAIDRALNYLSEQQLPSGGFVKYGDEDVEEDAAVLEMLVALGISLTDERFTKDDHTVLDGMMGWYQSEGITLDDEIKQGFYADYKSWRYNEYTQLWEGTEPVVVARRFRRLRVFHKWRNGGSKMHFDQYAFGRRVKYLRRKRNLTLEQMSSALNISIDHLSRIELGKRGASIDLTLDIANLLDVSVDFLVRGTSRMSPSTKKLIDQIRELLDGFEAM